MSLSSLTAKTSPARVGRAQHVPDVAVVAVGRLENKRHKPTLGVALGAGIDRHGGVERIETDEFVAIGATVVSMAFLCLAWGCRTGIREQCGYR